MRVLFTTWAWPSHYFPMVPLAWALQAAGHEVRMTSQPELLPTMRGSGLPVTAVGRDLDVAAMFRKAAQATRDEESPVPAMASAPQAQAQRLSERMAGELDRDSLRPSLRILREQEEETHSVFVKISAERAAAEAPARPSRRSRLSLYGEVAEVMVDDLLALARSWRPDLVVYDPLTHAGPLVAKLIGVPGVRSLFGPDVTYFINGAGEALGLGPLLGRFGLERLDLLGVASVDPCPPGLQFSDVRAPAVRLRCRYVAYNGICDVPGWLSGWSVRRRICLTWGTSVARLLGDGAFLPGELLAGCVRLAQECDAELVVAITSSQRCLLPVLPVGVRVVESVPLHALLPWCDVVVHQGGAGTLLTALSCGLPQLLVTQLVDQTANAIQVVGAGAGLNVGVAGLTADDVVVAGRELLGNPVYRVAAEGLRAEMVGLPSPAQIVDRLTALV